MSFSVSSFLTIAEASSSRRRVELTPPPTIDIAAEVFDEVGRLMPRISATTASGDIVTFPRRLRRVEDVQGDTGRIELLSTPLHRLLKEVDELRSRQKAIE